MLSMHYKNNLNLNQLVLGCAWCEPDERSGHCMLITGLASKVLCLSIATSHSRVMDYHNVTPSSDDRGKAGGSEVRCSHHVVAAAVMGLLLLLLVLLMMWPWVGMHGTVMPRRHRATSLLILLGYHVQHAWLSRVERLRYALTVTGDPAHSVSK